MRKKSFPSFCILIILAASLSAGCGRQHCLVKSAGRAYSDPFEYCGAVRNADLPGAPFSGPPLPPAIIAGLRKALNGTNIPDDILKAGSFWRCMEGKVYACFTGADIPCMAKADTTKTPDVAMLKFCTDSPEAGIIHAYVTGRMTVYSWRCRHGLPETVEQVAWPDSRGFIANHWYEIVQPPKAGP